MFDSLSSKNKIIFLNLIILILVSLIYIPLFNYIEYESRDGGFVSGNVFLIIPIIFIIFIINLYLIFNIFKNTKLGSLIGLDKINFLIFIILLIIILFLINTIIHAYNSFENKKLQNEFKSIKICNCSDFNFSDETNIFYNYSDSIQNGIKSACKWNNNLYCSNDLDCDMYITNLNNSKVICEFNKCKCIS